MTRKGSANNETGGLSAAGFLHVSFFGLSLVCDVGFVRHSYSTEVDMNWTLDNPSAFGVYALALGLLITGLALFYLNRGLSSLRWPSVEALITTSRLDEDSDGMFSVDVTYTYDVNGERYSRTENLTVYFPTRENAERLQREYPVGGAVVVRYNPSRPSLAVLRSGVSAKVWLWVTIGTAITALGVALLTGALRSG